jgi:hypothetical protein
VWRGKLCCFLGGSCTVRLEKEPMGHRNSNGLQLQGVIVVGFGKHQAGTGSGPARLAFGGITGRHLHFYPGSDLDMARGTRVDAVGNTACVLHSIIPLLLAFKLIIA